VPSVISPTAGYLSRALTSGSSGPFSLTAILSRTLKLRNFVLKSFIHQITGKSYVLIIINTSFKWAILLLHDYRRLYGGVAAPVGYMEEMSALYLNTSIWVSLTTFTKI